MSAHWLRRYNLLWGAVGAIIGFAIGIWIGHRLAGKFTWFTDTGQNDVSVLLGYTFSTIGFMAGAGFLHLPPPRVPGPPPPPAWKEGAGARPRPPPCP